jgi:hypothetical protein
MVSPAAAVNGALDQYSNNLSTYPLWGSDYSLAQTFTSGYLRPLTAVGIYAAPWGQTGTPGSAARGSATLQIVPVYNGLPNTDFPLLSEEVVIPMVDGGQWVYFNFSAPPLIDLHGQYAIVVTVHAPWGLEWLGSCSSSYKFGQAAVKGPADPYWLTVAQWDTVHHTTVCMGDFSFRTYVGSLPTPTPMPTPALTPTPTPTPTPAHTPAPTSAGGPTTGPGAIPPPPPPPSAHGTTTAPAASTATPDAAVAPTDLVAGATPEGSLVAAVAGSPEAGSPEATSLLAADPSSPSGGSSSGIPIATLMAAAAAIAVVGGAGAGLFLWRFRPRP